jgi:hypothetical protein
VNRLQLKSEPLVIEFLQVDIMLKEEQSDSVAQAFYGRSSESVAERVLSGIVEKSRGAGNA